MSDRTTRAAAALFCFFLAIVATLVFARLTRVTPVSGSIGSLVLMFPGGLVLPVMAALTRTSGMSPTMTVGIGWLIYLLVGWAIVVVDSKKRMAALFVLLVAMLAFNAFVLVVVSALGGLR